MATCVDTLIVAGWVLPVAPDENQVLRDHAIAITSGKIIDILPASDARSKYTAAMQLDRPESVVMPGLINAHTHTGMTLMRGLADDMPLLQWLHEVIWPVEAVFASKEEFCYDGVLLSVAEMVRGGVTCFADMYWSPDAAARAAIEIGVRAIIGMTLIAFPSAYASEVDEYIDKGHQVMERYRGEERLTFAYSPHAPYTVPTSAWEKLKDLSEEKGLRVHTHLHETEEECTASLALDRNNPACHMSDSKCHPLENFARIGLLSDRLVAAHMVHLTDDEITLCADMGVHVAHCPSSNSKLASGFCPVHKLLSAGVNVAIGTDSACSNNSLCMFNEMKLTALNAKNLAGDASAVPASTVLKMATINGAKAFGIDGITGSLEVGKSADLICIDVETHAGNSPMFHPHSAIVYAASRDDVNDVMVDGKLLLRCKKYCTLDLVDILRRMKHWRREIEQRFFSDH